MNHLGTADTYSPPDGPDVDRAIERADVVASYSLAAADERILKDLEDLAREWHAEYCERCGWDDGDVPMGDVDNPWAELAAAVREQYEAGLNIGARELLNRPRPTSTIKAFVDFFRRRERAERERAKELRAELREAKRQLAELTKQEA